MNANPSQEPKLAPPGAGIPWIQKKFLQYYVGPYVASRTPFELSRDRFVRTSAKILQELEGLSEPQLGQRVLVPKQTGLEDSSRYWSIAMTLDHIVIVGRQVVMVIDSLDSGVVPEVVADTSKVKPLGALSPQDAVQMFRDFSERDFPPVLPRLRNRNSKLRYRHPWFGPIPLQAWYWLLNTHSRIHLLQIRAIKAGLMQNRND
jgi:DinB superfamily